MNVISFQINRHVDPVASCTPREMLARGPRTAPGADTEFKEIAR